MNTPNINRLARKFADGGDDNFFTQWERIYAESAPVNVSFYEMRDNWMSRISPEQWPIFEKKVGDSCKVLDEKNKRHWEKLFDVFNESFGFFILTEKYRCSQIEFYDQKSVETPDIYGSTESQEYYLEVKTINHSQKERDSWFNGEHLQFTTELPYSLKRKIQKRYAKAKSQLNNISGPSDKKLLVAMVINLDYNIFSYQRSLLSLCREFLEEIENEDYYIEAMILKS